MITGYSRSEITLTMTIDVSWKMLNVFLKLETHTFNLGIENVGTKKVQTSILSLSRTI